MLYHFWFNIPNFRIPFPIKEKAAIEKSSLQKAVLNWHIAINDEKGLELATLASSLAFHDFSNWRKWNITRKIKPAETRAKLAFSVPLPRWYKRVWVVGKSFLASKVNSIVLLCEVFPTNTRDFGKSGVVFFDRDTWRVGNEELCFFCAIVGQSFSWWYDSKSLWSL